MNRARPVRAIGVWETSMTGITRSSDGLDVRRRRLLYRSWHRGTREMDLIIGRFADACIADLSEAELAEFERLADAPDPDIYAWVTGEAGIPEAYDNAIFHKLRAFHAGAASDE